MSRYSIAKHGLAVALFALASAVTAHAADGPIVITQAKANAGNVTPGDAPGFPVTLSRPGSYELASNLAVSAGSSGIQITAQDVTIDLNGFRIAGADTASNGIEGRENGAAIRNGTIDHFKNHGIYLGGSHAIVEDMRVVENGGDGIRAGGDARISANTIVGNGLTGVLCYAGCVVEKSTVAINGGSGVSCGASCHAEGNLVSTNGVNGIDLLDGGFALRNTVYHNVAYGLSAGSGISAYESNALVGNNAAGSGDQVGGAVSLHDNFCYPGACP